MKFSCLKKYKLFRKKTVNFRIIIIFFFIEAVLTITLTYVLEQKRRSSLAYLNTYFRAETRKKKKEKRFIALQSQLFLREVVFITGVFITKASYLDVLSLTIQVIVLNILNQARSRFRKDVAVLRRTQNFLSSDIPLTDINLSSDIPASYLRHPVTNKYDNNPKEI